MHHQLAVSARRRFEVGYNYLRALQHLPKHAPPRCGREAHAALDRRGYRGFA